MANEDTQIDLTKMPAQVELTVQGPDVPAEPISWLVQEYQGCELLRFVDGKIGEAVPATEKLVEGVQYCSASLFGGYHVGVVVDTGKYFYLNSGSLRGHLVCGGDARKVWSVVAWVNTRCLKTKLESESNA